MLELNTFSIVGRCERTGMLGVAVSTAVPAVGALCAHARAKVGAIATQSWTNPYLGIDGLDLLAEGRGAQAALERLIAGDPGRDLRQLAIVDASGKSAAWSGSGCTPWFGHRHGPNWSVQGNMLVGKATIEAMAEAFQQSEPLDLAERLLIALEAGQAAGGDKRGRQSAALKVVHEEAYPLLDLRVDEHRHPVAELRRIFEIARQQLLPFTSRLPTRARPEGASPEQAAKVLSVSPPYRPGGGGSAP